ncbi:MAG: hypothetical protein EAZ55_05270 [Cytophagales bacterium]|nr:MAG: hypothetical protein EAZ55_05270 [Cytophagales bacterium]
MTMMRNFILKSLFLLLCANIGFQIASAQIKLPAGKEKEGNEKWVLLTDTEKAKDFKTALPHLEWFLANAPDAHSSLYIKAANIYEGLAAAETVAAQKEEYQNKALAIYDERIKYFNDEANVLNRKGYKMYPYWSNKADKYDEMFATYKKIVELNKEKTFSQNIAYYMTILCSQRKANKVTDEVVLDEYDKMSAIADANIKLGGNSVAAWQQVKDFIDKQLESCVTINCDFVKTQYIPKFRNDPNNLDLLKKIYALMINGKCTDSPEMLEISQALIEKDPTFGRVKTHALLLKLNKDEAGYIKYIEKAATLATENADKAEIYLILAQSEAQKGNKAGARAWAFKAAETDGTQAGKAYSFVGYLYLASGSECTNSNPVIAKAVYIAAYNMFKRAGDGTGMAKAQAYFPTKEDVFSQAMGGQTVAVPCWVGESVQIPNY